MLIRFELGPRIAATVLEEIPAERWSDAGKPGALLSRALAWNPPATWTSTPGCGVVTSARCRGAVWTCGDGPRPTRSGEW